MEIKIEFGKNELYELFKFPDNSIKFKLLTEETIDKFIIKLNNNDDVIALFMISDVLERNGMLCNLEIHYMMYQQDDRLFNMNESYGLKVISKLFNNNLYFKYISIIGPHSDKVELINNVQIINNTNLIKWAMNQIGDISNKYWIIPDSGAFKTQFKQIDKMNHPLFVECNKSRNPQTNEVFTKMNIDDFQGKDIFIVDDIILGGRTILQLADLAKSKNCGKINVIVTHGIFNMGIDHILQKVDCIYTTDSKCNYPESDKLKIFKL